MKVSVLHAAGDLRIEERPLPAPGPGELRLRIDVGGICGSDLHYYRQGKNGTIALREPLTLGHEVAGTVDALGAGVGRFHEGQRVAINPSRPCRRCPTCIGGDAVHCPNGTFIGSAMRTPHVQGGFAEYLICHEDQLHPLPDHVPLADAVFAEPLAVCLHAVKHSRSMLGTRVLVTGSGPIGLLIVMLARLGGAIHVTATDINDRALAIARAVGAHETLNVAGGLKPDADHFDLAFECSGHPDGVATAIDALRPRGSLVQVGMLSGDVTAPLGRLVVKEIGLQGTFRFDAEFGEAVEMICAGVLDFRPLITHRLPLDDIRQALDIASDRARSMKVQIQFGNTP
ncbi:L-idonate 5-dehydrogenase [Pseudochelatococcus sp. B33]